MFPRVWNLPVRASAGLLLENAEKRIFQPWVVAGDPNGLASSVGRCLKVAIVRRIQNQRPEWTRRS
ncbi:hypothetical protein K438DRAFT_1834517 [Mycena galopus ATCC 62051]|nr:hypothetical protein K438DRAFT_1834516 [Mycena galopus ATCC 62051]KAF8187584.1 hypothetical protein K438DRAFT_1834517 [Mycena galopus ATCC 62051]